MQNNKLRIKRNVTRNTFELRKLSLGIDDDVPPSIKRRVVEIIDVHANAAKQSAQALAFGPCHPQRCNAMRKRSADSAKLSKNRLNAVESAIRANSTHKCTNSGSDIAAEYWQGSDPWASGTRTRQTRQCIGVFATQASARYGRKAPVSQGNDECLLVSGFDAIVAAKSCQDLDVR